MRCELRSQFADGALILGRPGCWPGAGAASDMSARFCSGARLSPSVNWDLICHVLMVMH